MVREAKKGLQEDRLHSPKHRNSHLISPDMRHESLKFIGKPERPLLCHKQKCYSYLALNTCFCARSLGRQPSDPTHKNGGGGMKFTKKRKRGQKVGKGAPSGLVVSLLFHMAIFFIAGLFVIFTVVNKTEPAFEPPQRIERPKMKLKKPKVKVKKSSQPKPSSRIVAKVKTKQMPEIQLPDLAGVGEGLMGGSGFGEGVLLDLPDLNQISTFGREQSIGNDFEGVLYQLSHDRSGGVASMDEDGFRVILRDYVMRGWDDSVLRKYYKFPKKLYATHFIIPPIPSPLGPDSFGAPDMECYYMFAVYKGKLVFQEDIKIRFWGMGDAYLFVNVDGKEVLLNGWATHMNYNFDWWRSRSSDNLTTMFCNLPMVVGDWIELKANEPVDMKVLFGEWKGGDMGAGLLVEVEGQEYPKSFWSGPLLPAFKTEELPWSVLTEIHKHLPEDECSLTDGPIFRDFGPAWSTNTIETVMPKINTDPELEPEIAVRHWTFSNGQTAEAKYKRILFDDVILETADGQEIRVAPEQLCEADQTYVLLCNPPKLKLDFSRKSKTRRFPPELFADNLPPEGAYVEFSAKVKQVSSPKKPYGFPLTLEFFAIGNQLMTDNRVLLDYKKEIFVLSKENDFMFRSTGRNMLLLDYSINNSRHGTRPSGHLILIRDQRGKIIAYKASSQSFYENRHKLSSYKIGWYFDQNCDLCLPEPPRHWSFKNVSF
jgi:hypothetical protein